jgi:transcriptional regulator with XRE-family HTH domain
MNSDASQRTYRRSNGFAKTFGGLVYAARKHKGLSLLDVSHISRVEPGNISKIERGLIVPRLDTALAIAQSVGISIDNLKNQ